ncbi:MAG: MFS transporter, partial [Candidatus Aenigmatarchaeota archaeon]
MKNNIRKLYLFNFFVSMHFIGGILLPFFTVWGGLSLTQMFLLESWFSLWLFVFEIPSGAFADRFGRKKTLSLAVLVNMVAVVVFSSAPNFLIFMAGEFLWALSGSLLSGTENALIYDTMKKIKSTKKSKSIFSRYESSGLLGIMIGSPIGSVIASVSGLNAPMFYLIVPFSIAFIISLTLKDPKFKSKSKSASYTSIMKSGIGYFVRHRTLKILALDMVVISTASYFM